MASRVEIFSWVDVCPVAPMPFKDYLRMSERPEKSPRKRISVNDWQ